MGLIKMVISHSKPLIPLMFGLCLGITLSLIVVPFNEGDCQHLNMERGSHHRFSRGGFRPRKTNSVNEKFNFDYGNIEDYEPRIRTVENVKPVETRRKKKLRPRYASTELGIREKLYVGVLTSRKTIETMGVAINRTLTHYVTKLVFFMDARGSLLPASMSVVSFSDERVNMRPFHMFKYIGDHYVKNFDWFYFITDESYVRGEKLFEAVKSMSISQDVYMGISVGGEKKAYCDVNAGILLSQTVMAKVYENLDWCIKNAGTSSHTDNIGQCVQHSTQVPCMQDVQNISYKSYLDKHLYLHRNPQAEWSTAHVNQLNSAITVHRIDKPSTTYKLHRYFCELELNQTQQDLEKTKEEIIKLAPLTPQGKDGLTWPIGADPPTQPKNRFDVIRWDYFTETHLYLNSDFSNYKELVGADKLDVQDILNITMDRLNKRHGNTLAYSRLVNGYRRFDPGRGMEYILDLVVKEKFSGKEIDKRVKLLRPLSFVEIVPMPYVTENSRINLVVPVTMKDKDFAVSFLDSYAKTCLDSGDNSNLYVIFIYEGTEPKAKKDDPYAVMKSMIQYYENKYVGSARMFSSTLVDMNPTEFTITDSISKTLAPESLILMGTVDMELTIEFLNRVRMNTINGWQTFFPIGFWQYKPNLVYNEKPYPTTVEINKNVGHFDANSYIVAGFYNSDYMYARKEMQKSAKRAKLTDLYTLFLQYHKLHVFRATEPALRHKYRERICNPVLNEETYSRCLKQRSEGLASRAQLAVLILEHQQNVDKGHMDIIHQQQNPNVDQMKPNMLKKKKK